MAAASAPTSVATNGHRVGTRYRIEVDQSELVHDLMDLEALAREAIHVNGYALQTVLGMLPSEVRYEIQQALHANHERLVALYGRARIAAGRYDHR